MLVVQPINSFSGTKQELEEPVVFLYERQRGLTWTQYLLALTRHLSEVASGLPRDEPRLELHRAVHELA